MTTGIIKKLWKITKNKKRKYNKIFVQARRKLNSIETLISQELTDLENSHEESIINEKGNYRRPTENIRNIKWDDELNAKIKIIENIGENSWNT